MNKLLQYISEFHENNQTEIDFINNQYVKHLKEVGSIDSAEVEHILDFLYSNKKTNISKIGYKTIKEKAEKWDKKLQSIKVKDDSDGIETVLDFKDGFKFVKLLSQASYEKEGKLMSHCVASYYGRNIDIYSLRDSHNNPHCTIEYGNQIKGKGNGKIDPKYIDYVVQFLEFKGMKVREGEMRNIGYYELSKIDKNLSCEKQYKGYVFEGNLVHIKDESGNTYRGLGILNIKDLVEIDEEMKFKINIDIRSTVDYLINLRSKVVRKKGVKVVGEYEGTLASSGDSSQLASSGDYSQLASSGHYSQLASSGHYSQLASSGDYSQLASSGHYSKLASSGDYSKLALDGKDSVGANIGRYGVIKGKKGCWITLAEYENDRNKYSRQQKPICVKSIQIDGEIIKEDTRYKLQGGEFIEVK